MLIMQAVDKDRINLIDTKKKKKLLKTFNVSIQRIILLPRAIQIIKNRNFKFFTSISRTINKKN